VPGEVCEKLEIFSRSDAIENDAEKSDAVSPAQASSQQKDAG